MLDRGRRRIQCHPSNVRANRIGHTNQDENVQNARTMHVFIPTNAHGGDEIPRKRRLLIQVAGEEEVEGEEEESLMNHDVRLC